MLEALRGLGYSPATALADIIDNSIAAGARTVDVTFHWNGPDSHVSILDDGCGMTDAGLERAMRLGERNPLDERAGSDLGRFGLGLKTASFSQARRLTVASRSDDTLSCLRWDLDVLAASPDGDWRLLEGPAEGSAHLLECLTGRGTLVLWEHMDRVVTPGFSEQDFLDLIDAVELHLAMVFHRFLEGSVPRLRLALNGRAVRPWDPFLRNHPATWTSPEVRFMAEGGAITIQGHVLPHKDRLDPRDHELAGGPDGWIAQQGFYVYRNQRLLVAGSWLGLGHGRAWTKEEAHRLARVRLDIPNSADADWKIDIRKSRARPPVSARTHLMHLAEDVRARARRVFAHRGQVVRTGGAHPIAEAWRAEHSSGGMRYRLDESHPAIRAVLDEAGVLLPQVRAMLRVIEETVPVRRIWLDTTEGRETPRTSFEGEAPAEVETVLRVMFRNMVQRKGMSPALAREHLLHTEPFHKYPGLVAALVKGDD
ncbi:ATP-binding protein [Pararhodospirillum oryzae]|nr:ATP-binding protein [Pararhodospirillum oryzae]